MFDAILHLNLIFKPTMKKFPSEFEDLLNANGKRILNSKQYPSNFTKKGAIPIEVVNNIIDQDTAAKCIAILDKTVYAKLKPISSKINPDELWGMKKNYTERLSKNLRMKTMEIGGPKSRSYEAAQACGLIQMLNSESLRKFGEVVASTRFGTAENNQVICYESGDYVSPHNDHHPENENVKNGFFDIHLMFSNRHVEHQLLVHEQNGYLNQCYDISQPAAMAIYKLPFWHYTTPLIAKPGKEKLARRWLLLRSFELSK